MKILKPFIIGGLFLFTFLMPIQHSHAAYCTPGQNDTRYKNVYCDMTPVSNNKADQKIVKIIADQFDLKEEVVDSILNDSLCPTLAQTTEEEKKTYPENLIIACSGGTTTTGRQLFAQNLLSDVKNAYQKEKAIYFNQQALTYKLKASEDYWDGKVGGPLDAPFDLISDLNLIEIVLFGSKAQWMGDVFTFPEKDELLEGAPDVPVDDDLLDDEEDPDEQKPDEQKDEGLEFEDLEPECVSPDDPNADPNADPGDALCGNGKIDLLQFEQCDDGNKKSGDGCNQYCQIEQGGSDLMCVDPEAVTFKKPKIQNNQQNDQNQNQNDQNENNNEEQVCPPGLVPAKIPKIWDENPNSLKEVPQALEYPGPTIGGTLKQFPESERPLCPAGHSPVEITIAGKKQIAKDPNGEPRCLPTQFCADFDKARDFLFGENWEDDEAVVNIAPAVEAMFCVDVIKNNRPLSPYPVIEGCVDCHISAMVDALEKALTTNVTPFKNTTSAFGLSSKFGPTFSFNLLTDTKQKITIKNNRSTPQSLMNTNKEFDRDKINDQAFLPNKQSSLDNLNKSESQTRTDAEFLTENLKAYNWSTGALSDLEMGQRVVPLLVQMQQSFANIQSSYEGMVASTAFNEKATCK